MDSASETDGRPDASTDEFEVQFLTFGPGYRVIAGDGTEHIVDVDRESCNCDGHRENGEPCEHLRRARRAISCGELPGSDGRDVRLLGAGQTSVPVYHSPSNSATADL